MLGIEARTNINRFFSLGILLNPALDSASFSCLASKSSPLPTLSIEENLTPDTKSIKKTFLSNIKLNNHGFASECCSNTYAYQLVAPTYCRLATFFFRLKMFVYHRLFKILFSRHSTWTGCYSCTY